MTKKRQSIGSLGTVVAVFLILIASYLSSVVYEAPQGPIPVFESPSGKSVTGLATTFTSICTDDKTILKVEGNTNAKAAAYDSTTYTKRICADALLGTGHTCKYATPTTTTTTTTLPAYCSNTAWDGDESDQLSANQGCGGSCNKCSAGYYCWANSDCSSSNCYFDAATIQKRNTAVPPILSTYRSTSPADIQYQGVCTAGTSQTSQQTSTSTSTSEGSSGVSVGTSLTAGAIADVTGEQFSLPSLSSLPSPSIGPSYCSDGVKSGDETDIDCGGSCLTKCANNLNCNTHSDCGSSYCDNGICKTSPLLTTPTTPTLKLPTITASQQAINAIVRLGSDGTVEKAGYSGPAATTTTSTTPITYSGTITTCNAQPGTSRCTPAAGPTGTKLLGIIDEFNSFGQMYNGYAIYVSDSVVGEVVKNPTCSVSQGCATSVCSKGTLQFEINEYDQDGQSVFRKYGICSDKKIKVASCSERTKGRTCTTNPPEAGLTKLSGYVLDIINNADGGRTFVYYDLYIQSQEAAPTTSSVTYTDVCFGNGPYHYETRPTTPVNKKGTCESGDCIFTISADTGAKVAACTSTNPNDIIYPASVCSGGYCVGTDCAQQGCQTQASCNSNPSCAWDAYETLVTKCKSRGNVCYDPGRVGICTPEAFRSGDYSCLYKPLGSKFYTRACVGAGGIAFWQIPEVY